DHGKHELHRPLEGDAERGAELSTEEVLALEAEADRPAAEKRVGLDAADGLLVELVRSRVERADDELAAAERLDRRSIAVKVRLLVGLAVLIEELGAIEANARRAPFERRLDLVRELDVRSEGDRVSVERLRGPLDLLVELALESLGVLSLPAVVLELRGLGIDDDDAGVAIDH